MRILRSYILRLHLVPFMLGFGVVTFILEMDALVEYLDLAVNRGIAAWVVAQLFVLSLGYIVALSLPCAVLVAVLMTFGRLSQDNEITALRAGGVNLASVLVGPLAASAILAYGLTLFNNYVLPESNHAFANLMIDIGRMRPTVKLQEGEFITDFPGYSLLVQSVNGRTNEMRGVTLYQTHPDGPPTTILARRGYLYYTPDGRSAVLELKDGEIHEIPADEPSKQRYRRLVFTTHVIHIPGVGGALERSARDARSDREMSARSLLDERTRVQHQYDEALRARLQRLEQLAARRIASDSKTGERTPGRHPGDRAIPAPPRDLTTGQAPERWGAVLGRLLHREDEIDRLARSDPELGTELELWRVERQTLRRRIASLSVEIHKKFSLPVACVVFVLIGAPIGMRVRRAGPGVAFVSVGFFLFYYLCLVGGEELAVRLMLPPWLSMWLPNLVLGWWGVVWTLEACEILPRAPRPARAADSRRRESPAGAAA